jgi:hypothetical protein
MAANQRGPTIPPQISGEYAQDFSAFVRAFFVNEFPFFTRLDPRATTNNIFNIVSYQPRPLTGYTLGAAFADTTGTTLTMSGTTAATHLINAAVRVMYNASSGGEIDREASRPPRTVATQWLQTFLKAVQVGGLVEAMSPSIGLPVGLTSAFGRDRGIKLLEWTREIEQALFLGTGEAPAAGVNAKQKGFKALLPTANITTAADITDETAYTPLSLIRDLLDKPIQNGGNPDLIMVASNFVTGMATWAMQMFVYSVGTTGLGTPINEIFLPLRARPIRIIEVPLLPSGTACSATSEELALRYIRPISFQQRGIRGDAIEGDWIGDYALEMVNPSHHAWVEGITGFAKP